jgi:hypothetical protein
MKMPSSEIICLANSRKHAGRCVVGLRTDGKGWVRPVTRHPDGTLFQKHYTLKDGTEAQVLDVIKIPLVEPNPRPHHPENYIIRNFSWKLIARPATEDHIFSILEHVEPGPYIFGDDSDRISYDEICDSGIKESVALVKPGNLRWQIKKTRSGKRQTRAIFRLGRAQYNLALTDPVWEDAMGHLPYGTHRLSKSGLKDTDKILFTISLGEPFDDDNCYKLVAAVILLPDSLRVIL